MLPKNNRSSFPNVSKIQTPSANMNQTFRPSVSYNSNLIVTQQQQPSRGINNTFMPVPPNNTNANNNNTINHMENATKRFAAAINQPQSAPLHLVGRTSSSPVQINTSGTNQQIVLDRQQLIRLPQQSTNQAESAQMNNIYQALYLIQQNLIQQGDKNKSTINHQTDIHRTISNTINSSSANNNITSNSQPISHIDSNISLNSTSQNQNTTVLTMSNADLQLLEAISRLNSQQAQKQTNHPNVSLIQPDCAVAQQLLNALQKQNSRTCSSTATTMPSPGFMLIGPSGSKSSQLITNKDSLNIPATSAHFNNNEVTKSLILKMPLNSKTDVPVWTKLLDKLSNNPENVEVNRSYKMRDMDDNQRNMNIRILPQSRLQPETTKYHSKESLPRHNGLLISSNSLKTNAMSTKPSTNTHQILRDSKIISYMMPSSNSVSINNDDMINQHFRESLRDKLDIKSDISSTPLNYKTFDFPTNNLDKATLNNTGLNMLNIRKKSYGSFIDLERPEYGCKSGAGGTVRVSTPNQSDIVISISNNNNLSIKETTDAMVENLIKKSLDSKYSVGKHNSGPSNCAQVISRPQGLNELARRDCSNNKICQPLINTHCDNVVINTRDHFVNSTSMLQEVKFTNVRPNPLKSDLPLKKRIMLNFNENGDEDMTETLTLVSNVESNLESNVKNEKTEEKLLKVRRKRVYSDSLTGDKKSESPHDCNVSTIKKHRGRKPGSGKNQKWKEECRLKEIATINQAGTEETWLELIKTIIKPPDIESISAKTLTTFNLEPLKLSKEHFFQIGSCTEIAPRMVKCRCCRQNTTTTNIESSNTIIDDVSSTKSGSKDSSTTTVVSSFCRFHGFRKLQFSIKGTLVQAGFCKSNEADDQDLSLWRMYQPLSSEMSVSIATYIVEALSAIFCEIINAENTFLQKNHDSLNDFDQRSVISKSGQVNVHNNGNKPELDGFVWKRPVQGVREMCDVCETSIFNSHWTCRKCGYSICVDCFNERYDSLLCNHSSSEQKEGKEKDNDTLNTTSSNVIKNTIHQNTRGVNKNRYFSCDHPWAVCTANRQQHNPETMLKVELIPIKLINELRNRMHTVARLLNIRLKCNCLVTSKSETKLFKQMSLDSIPAIENDNMSGGNYDLHMLADIALKEVVNTDNKEERPCLTGAPRPPPVLSPPHHPENNGYVNCVTQDSKRSETNISVYSWINVSSNFRMMHLLDAQSPDNLKLFQQEWRRAHPILVSGCHNTMDLSLWTPEKFLEEFESEPAFFVDCESGLPVPRATMKSFWEGFSYVSKRISCSEGSTKPACLKLKDWPPSEDLNDVLPQRCKDIMSNMPIKEYTARQGELNLAAHLSDFFVRPDLGPKLYNAYGMPRECKLGTTNLHLDIADAVNVMLYIGVPSDQIEKETQNTLESMKEANVDNCVIKRAERELPGALWHIFLPKDVPKLREFLNDIMLERGESLSPNQDPIHDQQFYLDMHLLNRLKEKKDVEGCAIVQFRGDAVFIPAGSPHQVRNLHSCMKVANDFVSPENILNCLLVTKEFRKLSTTHANHEDKLQAKNMIFHAMKDAVSTLITKGGSSLSEINGKPKDQLKRKRNNQTEETKLISWPVKEKHMDSVEESNVSKRV